MAASNMAGVAEVAQIDGRICGQKIYIALGIGVQCLCAFGRQRQQMRWPRCALRLRALLLPWRLRHNDMDIGAAQPKRTDPGNALGGWP